MWNLLFFAVWFAAPAKMPITGWQKDVTDAVRSRDTLPQGLVICMLEVEASVDLKAWRQHLEAFLPGRLDSVVQREKIPAGTYSVRVCFLVEKDGSIHHVQAPLPLGNGLDGIAMDAVRQGPRWRPGERNGQKTRSYHHQPITFVIPNEQVERRNADGRRVE